MATSQPLIEKEPARKADLHCNISDEAKEFLEVLRTQHGQSYGRVVDRLVRAEKKLHPDIVESKKRGGR